MYGEKFINILRQYEHFQVYRAFSVAPVKLINFVWFKRWQRYLKLSVFHDITLFHNEIHDYTVIDPSYRREWEKREHADIWQLIFFPPSR